MKSTICGRLKLPPTVLNIISKRVPLKVKSLGSSRKKSLRDREVSASNFCVQSLENWMGRERGYDLHCVRQCQAPLQVEIPPQKCG